MVLKERPATSPTALYANTDTNRPDTRGRHRRRRPTVVAAPRALPPATWTHLAADLRRRARCGCTSTARRSAQPRRPGRSRRRRRRCGSAATRSGASASTAGSTRCASTTARSRAAEIQDDMNRSVTPDTTPPTVSTKTPPRRRGGRQRRHRGDGDVQRARCAPSSHHVLERSRSRTPGGAGVPATVTLRPGDEHRDADAAGGAPVRHDLHGDRQGRARRRHRLRRQPARRRRHLVVHDRGLAAAGPRRRARPANQFGTYLGEILRNEGLNAFTTLDVSLLSPALLSGFDVVVLGETPLTRSQVIDADELGERRRQPDRDAPDKQLAGLLGLTDAGATLANAYLQVDTTAAPGHGDRRQHDPVPRHRRPLHARRRDGGRDALLEREHRDGEPGRDAALGRLERRPGGGVHLRPRALGRLHAAGQPGVGRTGARRRRRHPPRRHVLRRRGRRRAAGLARHEQDRDPAGRRAAAAARST